MKKTRYSLFVYLLAVFWAHSACFAKSCSAAPEVSITAASQTKHNGVRLRWKIFNRGTQPVFVYSTFLNRRDALTWERKKDGTLAIYTFLPAKLSMTVYSFPKATFAKLGPKATIEGVFDDSRPTVRVHKSDKVILLVAYGTEIEHLQKNLGEYSHSGDGHPANPIVDWQCVAASNETKVH